MIQAEQRGIKAELAAGRISTGRLTGDLRWILEGKMDASILLNRENNAGSATADHLVCHTE